jgi:hypothetical protein
MAESLKIEGTLVPGTLPPKGQIWRGFRAEHRKNPEISTFSGGRKTPIFRAKNWRPKRGLVV